MKYIITLGLLILCAEVLTQVQVAKAQQSTTGDEDFKIGWSTISITPDQPVYLAGQFPARISEGVWDPVKATAMAIESDNENVIMVSVDLVSIAKELLEAVQHQVKKQLPNVREENILINATHTHSAPYASPTGIKEMYGINPDILGDDILSPPEYLDFAADQIAKVVEQAWDNRQQSGISYGLGDAVVGHNRLAVYDDSSAQMYGDVDTPDFSHIEGYEDHSVNLVYTWDSSEELTGIVVNVASPSQVSEHSYHISADFWHDVREMINEEFGRNIPILAQASSAGDQSPHVMVQKRAEERMQEIMFDEEDTGRGSMGRRKQVATRIVDAIVTIYPYMRDYINWNPSFGVQSETIKMPRRMISQKDVDYAQELAKEHAKRYEKAKKELETNQKLKEDPRWYTEITGMYRRTQRGVTTNERFKLQKREPEVDFDIHVVQLGDIAFATNPFELYLDYGIRMKARSPAIQTFVVQLTGSKGQYLPPQRSVAGNAYGAIPASTIVGPKGGKILVKSTLDMIESIWKEVE